METRIITTETAVIRIPETDPVLMDKETVNKAVAELVYGSYDDDARHEARAKSILAGRGEKIAA